MAVHERRHSEFAYLPFAISIRELVDREGGFNLKKVSICTPSPEGDHIQFCP